MYIMLILMLAKNIKMEKTVELLKKFKEFGIASLDEKWPNYVESLKLKKKDSKFLKQIVSSSNLSLITNGASIEEFAAMHAWRSLGQLNAKESIRILLNTLIDLKNEEAFWFRIELPTVLKLIGSESIKQLASFIKKNEHRWDDKIVIVKGLVEIAIQFPENKESIKEIINSILKKYKKNDLPYNACLLNEFFRLKPYDNELIKEIINNDCFDYNFINRPELDIFIKESKMYN